MDEVALWLYRALLILQTQLDARAPSLTTPPPSLSPSSLPTMPNLFPPDKKKKTERDGRVAAALLRARPGEP